MKHYYDVFLFFIVIIFLFFFYLFLHKSFSTMIRISFYEFDEAHRAETAKRMLEYKSFFVPLTGSPFDRVFNGIGAPTVAFKENPFLRLYYHLERPPLVYLFMIGSVLTLGSHEFSYRLPSFTFGVLVLLSYFFFAREMRKHIHYPALFSGLLLLMTSSDLWLSSQYAQLDTGITLFLFLSLLFLLLYCQRKRSIFLFLTGISFGLAILSKGQPAVIFLIPVFFLFFQKRLAFSEIVKLFTITLVTLSPWLLYISFNFGLNNFIAAFFGFAFSSATQTDIHQQAPFFWYIRWFWESLRPGWTVFLALLFLDIFHRRLVWEKQALLTYIVGSLLILSIPANKIWWYTLPLVPPMALYLYLSLSDYIQRSYTRLFFVGMAILVASMPFALRATNTNAALYGIVITAIVVGILDNRFLTATPMKVALSVVFLLSIIISFYWFALRFPKIVPYHPGVRRVAQYFASLPGRKCLWAKDMPLETALFYSNAGEISILNKESTFEKHCKHYAIVHEEYPGEYSQELEGKKQIYKRDKIILYEL